MARNKRIVPDVDHLGVVRPNKPSALPNYNIVGAAGTPTGPDPLGQLAQALSGFNKNLSHAAKGMRVAQERDALAAVPELLKNVDETSTNIAATTKRMGISNIFNPGVPFAAHVKTAALQGKQDVKNFMRSPEFIQTAAEELEVGGDFRQRLYDNIISNLPNREGSGGVWKRGYDPAVLSEANAALVRYENIAKERVEGGIRESVVVHMQDTLSEAIETGDPKAFIEELITSKSSWPSNPRTGVTMIDDVIMKAIRPVFTNALSDPDADPEELGILYKKIMGSRKMTPKGSSRVFGSRAETDKEWMVAKMDAEARQPSRSAVRDATDRAEIVNVVTSTVVQGWPDLLKEHPELASELAAAGVNQFSDLDPSRNPNGVEAFGTLIAAVNDSGWHTFDEDLMARQSRGQWVSIVETLTDLSRAASNAEVKDETQARLNATAMLQEKLGSHPLWASTIDKFAPSLASVLMGTTSIKDTYRTVGEDVAKALSTHTKFGVNTLALGGVISDMLMQNADGMASAEAEAFIGRTNQALDAGKPVNADQIRNMIDKSFTGEGPIDSRLNALMDRVEGSRSLQPLYKEPTLKISSVLNELAGLLAATDSDPGSVFYKQIVSALNIRNSQVVASSEEDAGGRAELSATNNKQDVKSVGAATLVLQKITADYNDIKYRLFGEFRDKHVGKDLEEEFRKPTGAPELKRELIAELRGRSAEYIETFNSLTKPFNTTESVSESTPSVPVSPRETKQLHTIRAANLEQLQGLVQDTLGVVNGLAVPGGKTTFNRLTGISKENTQNIATHYYVGDLGDDRYAKNEKAKKLAFKVGKNIEDKWTSLQIARETASKGLNPDADALKANADGIVAVEKQYKDHFLKFYGVPWQALAEKGETTIGFSNGGHTLDIPITYKDIDFDTTPMYDTWEGMVENENLYNAWEENEKNPNPDYVLPEKLVKHSEFIHQALGFNLFDKSDAMREAATRKYDVFATKQRSLMISNDLSKLPDDINISIKQQILKNFFVDKDNMFKGQQYTVNDKARVKSVFEWNNLVAHEDFSMKKGLTPEEFQKGYAVIVGGRMYQDTIHQRGGVGRGSAGANTRTDAVNPSQPLSKKQKDVIADELAMALMGVADATTANPFAEYTPHKNLKNREHREPTGIGKWTAWADLGLSEVEFGSKKRTPSHRVHPLRRHTVVRNAYLGKYAVMRKLLDSKGRSTELAEAFRELHKRSDFSRTYQDAESNDLLNPFGLTILTIPDR